MPAARVCDRAPSAVVRSRPAWGMPPATSLGFASLNGRLAAHPGAASALAMMNGFLEESGMEIRPQAPTASLMSDGPDFLADP